MRAYMHIRVYKCTAYIYMLHIADIVHLYIVYILCVYMCVQYMYSMDVHLFIKGVKSD